MQGDLFGRDRELERVTGLLDGAASHGGALLVRGHAGLGKTRLLQSAVSAATRRRMRVLTISGVQLEADLPFAGLHQLVQPFLNQLGELPAPQRDAVRAAFGLTRATPPEPFLITLALLSLLGDLTNGAPLLLAVDDAQWLDRPSSAVLAVMARRLEPTSVVLVAAGRAGHDSPLLNAGLPTLDLASLDTSAATALLDASAPDLTPAQREQVLALAAGHPLALLELPEVLAAQDAGHRIALPLLAPLTPRLEQAFATTGLQLPDATRSLLLVAAASDTGSLDEVLRAGAALGAEPEAAQWLTPAIDAGVIGVDGPAIRFRHPLLRAVVYGEAAAPERRAAHAALARLLDGQPERQAWHDAATVNGPDETVAERLERAAGQAMRRGAVAAAVAAAERAATLTAEPMLRGSRLLHAAELALDLGQSDVVGRLTAAARWLPLRTSDQIKAAWLERAADQKLSEDQGVVRSLAELADEARGADAPGLALNILLEAAFRSFWGGGHDRQLGQRLTANLANLPGPADDPRRLAALAFADPVGQGPMVTEAITRLERAIRTDARSAYAAGVSAAIVGEAALSASLLASAVTMFRSQGRTQLLARALAVQAWNAVHRADWITAVPAAREGIKLAAETGQPLFVTVGQETLLVLSAQRGDDGAAAPLSSSYGLAVTQVAQGLSALGAARYGEAYEHLRRIFDPADPARHHARQYWHIHDLAEAAARSDHHEQARARLTALEPGPARTPAPWLRARLYYARALLADDDQAEPLFRAAIDASDSVPFVHARAELAYGTWLRRQRRIAESRQPLHTAAASFDTLGFRPWVNRAGQELRASGDVTSVPAAPPQSGLSPQERQIAELAASGLSNRQIGQRLYMSHRTVGTHLYRIFPKLGVSSRHQIRQVLGP
jgi:DNA-binding CsgD family transcriptional regulator/tetratricopeptide (TPR) repeat protein